MYGMKIPTTYVINRTGMVFENGVCVDPGVETPDPRDEALRLAREALVNYQRAGFKYGDPAWRCPRRHRRAGARSAVEGVTGMAQEQLTQIVNLIARAEKAERERDEARAELEEIETALVAAGQYRLVGDDTTRAGRIAWLKEDCRRLHKEKLNVIYGEGGRNALRERAEKAEAECAALSQECDDAETIARNAISKAEKAERERDDLAKKVYVPGLWKCAKCGFTLVQRVLRASDGAVGVRDEAGENCPNDGSPLWRVSERDARNELADRAQEYLERAMAAERERDDAKKRVAVLEDSLDWFADVNGDGPQRDAAILLGERATP